MRGLFQYILLSGFLILASVRLWGQVPEVTISMKPDTILIGDHVTVRLEVHKDMMQVIDFPMFDNTKSKGGIYVVRDMPVDTLEVSGRRQSLVKEYIVTAFKEGAYSLGKFPVLYVDKNITDTLYVGDSLRLWVNTLELDTVGTTIYDIKPPVHARMMVDEIKGYVIGGILLACVLASVIWFAARAVSRRRRTAAGDGGPKPVTEPHIKAIRELEQLHNQKLWQNNKHKLYYTRLTDVLREYLEGRFGIGAMEMTSDEIMEAVSELQLTDKNYDGLNDLLRTADLVKFAKYIPEGDYNENVYYNAYYFIEDTKEVPEEVKESEVTEIQPDNVAGDE